ncbi:MAG: hypothetical protein JO228_11235 [Xanthobacteraceae bacterium]|nr:hypothetical protein [Xanthobacteraceae bacterium]
MKAHAETSAGRIPDSALMIAGALGGVLIFTVAFPFTLSNPFPTPKQNDWVIAPAPPANPATYELASLPTERIVVPARLQTASLEAGDLPVADFVSPETTSAIAKTAAGRASSTAVRIPVEAATPAVLTISSEEEDAPAGKPSVVHVSFADRWTSAMAVPEVASSVQMPPEAAVLEIPDRRAAAAPPAKRRDVGIMEEVDRYLWEVYQRKTVKSDSSGDFTWKDPAAAKHAGLSMEEYVIRGMDADFREQLYHAGRAMDGQGINWSMLSAFRDDYRQSLASGFKAHVGNSKHGGSRAVGGYGHGQAIDITTADGDSDTVWHWIDAHGAKYGLHRPIPGPDPAHVQPTAKWHEIAVALRTSRVKVADREAEQSKAKVAGVAPR